MYLKENQTLDQDKTYPCPVCRSGSLTLITLTEAWGCGTCQEIFEQKAPDQIRRVTAYPRQVNWQWTGKSWVRSRLPQKPDRLRRFIGAIALVLLIWLALTTLELIDIPVKIGVVALILIALIIVWIGLRR